MKKQLQLLLILPSLIFSQVQNDKLLSVNEILKKADSSCKSLESIKYNVTFKQALTKIEATIFQVNSNVGDPIFGNSKILVQGNKFVGDNRAKFEYSYDGKDFNFLEEKDLLKIENAEGKSIVRTIGLNYYMIVRTQFGSEKGIEFLLKDAVKSTLIGNSIVKNRDAFHIKIINQFKNPSTQKITKSESNWYFDKKTFLPIKFVSNKGTVTSEVEIIAINENFNINFNINKDTSAKEKIISGNEAKTEGLLSIGTIFPDFNLKDIKGEAYNQEILKSNKITIVDFWGTWCGPCLKAMPKLQELYTMYNKRGLNIIGISVKDKPNKAKSYVLSKGYTYQFFEMGDDLANTLELNTYPTIYILDHKGRVIYREKGIREGSKIDYIKIIEKYIN
jgi:thiol-disulfide isomerase/thioredoxin